MIEGGAGRPDALGQRLPEEIAQVVGPLARIGEGDDDRASPAERVRADRELVARKARAQPFLELVPDRASPRGAGDPRGEHAGDGDRPHAGKDEARRGEADGATDHAAEGGAHALRLAVIERYLPFRVA